MADIVADAGTVHVVDVPNGGAIPGLPDDVVVEVSARVGAAGVEPIPVAPLRPDVDALVRTMKDVELLTVEAAVHGDELAAQRALAAHPAGAGGERRRRAVAPSAAGQRRDARPARPVSWRREPAPVLSGVAVDSVSVVLGVDGGGTEDRRLRGHAGRSGARLRVRAGRELGDRGPRRHAVRRFRDGLRTACASAESEPADVRAVACCMAGVDWPSDVARRRRRPGRGAPGRRRSSPTMPSPRCGPGLPDGIGLVSVAGTGGVTAGKDRRGRTARTMGSTLGEGAGATGITRRALDALARFHHGQAEAATRLPAPCAHRSAAPTCPSSSNGSRGNGSRSAPHKRPSSWIWPMPAIPSPARSSATRPASTART